MKQDIVLFFAQKKEFILAFVNENGYGRKIFFIYPNSLIWDDIIIPLIDWEYEIYTLNDHSKIRSLKRRFNNPIILLNIDEKLTPSEWDSIIASEGPENLGIFSYNDNPNLGIKYSNLTASSLGFYSLRRRVSDLLKDLHSRLENLNIKENRKYIRARFESDNARFEFMHNNIRRTGYIRDISSVGMTIVFKKAMILEKNMILSGINLFIRESVIPISGVFLGIKRNTEKEVLYVILFDKNVKGATRSRLKLLINSHNREEILKRDQIPVAAIED